MENGSLRREKIWKHWLDVPEPMRTAMLKAIPIMESLRMGTSFRLSAKVFELEFKIGERFLYRNPLLVGREMNMIATWEGNKQVIINAC